MKPKYRNLLAKGFPSIITISAFAGVANAAIILPDPSGNVIVAVAGSGANTVQTGFSPPAGLREIRIESGAFLNPTGADAIEIQATNASGATYTVSNFGTLTTDGATGNHGIDTADLPGITPSVTVNNTGTISGASAIRANNLLTLSNEGALIGAGAADAAVFTKNGGTITNGGTTNNSSGATITGVVDGIRSEASAGTLVLTNYGRINGISGDGVRTEGTLTLTNQYQVLGGGAASIIGGTNGVTTLSTGSVINNSGQITGNAGIGIRIGDGGQINNLSVFNPLPPFKRIGGGTITGATHGVFAGDDLVLTNQLSGRILGGSGDGINAGNRLTLTNFGDIFTPGDDAVSAGSGSDILNAGNISGNFGIFLYNGDAVVTNNSGATISGTDAAILSGGGIAVTINNAGTIIGDTAFNGTGGNDTLNFNLGSNVRGDLFGDGGTDVINLDGGLTAIGGLNNIIRGDIDGFTGINKTGTGVAFIGLPGDSLASVQVDTINISGGGLYINGDVFGNSTSLATINANGAALGGTGTWDANVFVQSGGISAGAIPINLDSNPLSSVGTLEITGNVVHSPGSFIRFDVAGGTPVNNGVNSDLILQTGSSTYNVTGANLRISPTTQGSPISNGTYTVIDSQQAIVGFNSLGNIGVQFNNNVNGSDSGFIGSQTFNTGVSSQDPVFLRFVTVGLEDGNTNLVLNVQRNYAGGLGLTGNAASLGGALDASAGVSTNAALQDFITALDFSDIGTVQATLGSISPEGVLSLTTGVMSSNYRLHRVVQDHLAATRSSGAQQVVVSPATTDAKGGMIPAQTSTHTNAGNVWGTLSYDWKDYNGDGAEFDGEDGSFSVGVDFRVSPTLLIGVLLDGSKADYDYNGGGSDVDSLRGALYGTYGQATGIYSDFLVGYGAHDLESRRNFGGLLAGSSANGETDADSFQALFTVGYAMQAGVVKHGPFVGFEYQNVDVDGFTQSGIIPVGVPGYDEESLRALIGYRVEAAYGNWMPFASLTYAHECHDDGFRATAVLPGGASYQVRSGGMDSAFLISIGTGLQLTPTLSANIAYHGEVSTGDGIDSHGASIGLNCSF